MSPLIVVLLGCLVILLFDTTGSLFTRWTGFPYVWLAPVSLLIYAGTGLLTADAGDGRVIVGALAGAVVAAVESTFGWRISRRLGADTNEVSERQEMGTTTLVTLTGAVLGALGAAVG